MMLFVSVTIPFVFLYDQSYFVTGQILFIYLTLLFLFHFPFVYPLVKPQILWDEKDAQLYIQNFVAITLSIFGWMPYGIIYDDKQLVMQMVIDLKKGSPYGDP